MLMYVVTKDFLPDSVFSRNSEAEKFCKNQRKIERKKNTVKGDGFVLKDYGHFSVWSIWTFELDANVNYKIKNAYVDKRFGHLKLLNGGERKQ